jgi:striatin 1/3/4
MAWQSPSGMGIGNGGNNGGDGGNQSNQPQGTEYTLQGRVIAGMEVRQ